MYITTMFNDKGNQITSKRNIAAGRTAADRQHRYVNEATGKIEGFDIRAVKPHQWLLFGTVGVLVLLLLFGAGRVLANMMWGDRPADWLPEKGNVPAVLVARQLDTPTPMPPTAAPTQAATAVPEMALATKTQCLIANNADKTFKTLPDNNLALEICAGWEPIVKNWVVFPPSLYTADLAAKYITYKYPVVTPAPTPAGVTYATRMITTLERVFQIDGCNEAKTECLARDFWSDLVYLDYDKIGNVVAMWTPDTQYQLSNGKITKADKQTTSAQAELKDWNLVYGVKLVKDKQGWKLAEIVSKYHKKADTPDFPRVATPAK